LNLKANINPSLLNFDKLSPLAFLVASIVAVTIVVLQNSKGSDNIGGDLD